MQMTKKHRGRETQSYYIYSNEIQGPENLRKTIVIKYTQHDIYHLTILRIQPSGIKYITHCCAATISPELRCLPELKLYTR